MAMPSIFPPRTFVHPLSALVLAVIAPFGLSGCALDAIDESKSPEIFFPPNEVCTYPANGPIATFRNLGGGTWEPSGHAERTTSFECAGANRIVRLIDDSSGKIEMEYHARGIDRGATMLTLKYRVSAARPIANESTYRNQFTNLVDNTSKMALKETLPELFRRRMGNLESFGRTGKALSENYDVGNGFVSVTRQASEDRLNLSVEAKLYSDAAMKLKN